MPGGVSSIKADSSEEDFTSDADTVSTNADGSSESRRTDFLINVL
jgi:hypothetical protein